MKQIFLSIAILLAGITSNQAQNTFPSTGAAGIGTTSPNASSLLEINSVTKGFLAPRMTRVQRIAIPTPAIGLLVYQTDGTYGFYYYYCAGWTRLLGSGATQTLSNLTAPVAINQSLLPGTTATIDLGSSTKQWRDAYLSGGGLTVTTTTGGVNSYSTSSYGVLGASGGGIGVQGSSADGTGVWASSDGNGYGVYASSSTNYGLLAINNIGSYGVVASGGYAGIYGTGDTYGVYGNSNTYGVYANGTAYGSYSAGNVGAYGFSSSTGGDAVHGKATGTAGYGVFGESTLSIGVYGYTANTDSYAGYFAGNVYTSGSYQPSDQKLKQNIQDFTGGMDIINKLHPKTYDYRQDGNLKMMNLPTGSQYGLIAQDVEKVLPMAVKATEFNVGKTLAEEPNPVGTTGNTDRKLPPVKPAETAKPKQPIKDEVINFKAINYTALIPVMIQGMQEQDSKIKEQQVEIVNLKQVHEVEIANLKSEINELKAMILKNGSSNSFGGYLKQNIPNPSNNSTTIAYAVPGNTTRSEIRITDAKGSSIKTYSVKGAGQLTIQSGELPAGVYNYSLYANNKVIDTKQMVVVK